MHRMDDQTAKKLAYRVETIGIAVNIALTCFKLYAGLAAASDAMVSDAVHSASDILGSLIVIIGVHMAHKASDREHPYGHERMECVAAMTLAVILAATGIGIGMGSLSNLRAGLAGQLEAPGMLALVAAVVSIVLKETLYRITRSVAEKIRSGAVMASAWHHRSDAFSSVGSFAGILGARIGFPVLDPVAGMIICVLIVKAAYDIAADAFNKMVDRSCDERTEQKIREAALAQSGVVRIDRLKTRMFGSKIYIDIEIALAGTLSLYDSHEIAEKVHHELERLFPPVKHCMVHVNPADEKAENG